MNSRKSTKSTPSALENLGEIWNLARGRRLAVFLDYDGTLTPIVDSPNQAVLGEEMRGVLRSLARFCPVAVISGRDLRDVRERVQVGGIFYAGSHGFEIAFPDGKTWEHSLAANYLPDLDQAEEKLQEKLSKIDGALVERKRFSLAVHYRRVAEERVSAVEKIVHKLGQEYPELRQSAGKKIYELQPRIEWNKGEALLLLLKNLGLNEREVLSWYIGDDLTDEDAFRALKERGVGILVGKNFRQTAARYFLKNPREVRIFLDKVRSMLEEETAA